MSNRILKISGTVALVLLLALSLTTCWHGGAGTGTDITGRVLVVTDLHINPFADPAVFTDLLGSPVEAWDSIFRQSVRDLGDYNQATTFWLMDTALQYMAAEVSDVDMVLFLGDVLAHHFEDLFYQAYGSVDEARADDFIRRTVEFFHARLSAAFPGKPIIFIPGNNDYYCGDYQIQPDGPFLADTAPTIVAGLQASLSARAEAEAAYRKGGYYRLPAPASSGQSLQAANAVFFSINYQNACGVEPDTVPGAAQLEWLRGQLEAARQSEQKVWLLMHIPVGLNIFNTVNFNMTNGRITEVADFWNEDFGREMRGLLTEYAGEIAAVLTGHTHQDDFRVDRESGIFNIIVPALSPVFSNNPGFKVFTYNRLTMEIRNYETHFLDLSVWAGADPADAQWDKSYDFNETYGYDGLSVDTLADLQTRIRDDRKVKETFHNLYDVSNPKANPFTDPDHDKAYWCGMSEWNRVDFLDCYNN